MSRQVETENETMVMEIGLGSTWKFLPYRCGVRIILGLQSGNKVLHVAASMYQKHNYLRPLLEKKSASWMGPGIGTCMQFLAKSIYVCGGCTGVGQKCPTK